MKYLTVQQVANIAHLSKSGMWKRIRHTSNFKQYMSTDSKTNARLISPKGINILLLKGKRKKNRVVHVSSAMYFSMLADNQRQSDEIKRLTKLLSHQQQITENAQREAHQLKLNPPKKHGIIWHWFHR